MQFTAKFTTLAFAVVAATVYVAASPAPVASIVTPNEFLNWLDTTDANITYIGEPIDRNAPRAADSVMVTYCSKRTQGVGCGGSCNQLSTCGTRLDNGFCYTPGTASINVPPF
ncbi:hypothetical protein L227DRAFT_612620 [Lentinus tigrinus ALCF2SS1-6]|uniref:Uncharacterized protein n=1 Tax=Lentinus tigrinus ALCF2SS1-6 TaxID=1328759 RepID=A0A5C2S5D1_9APHY|nr:hypothetical protein L227DRAFT_612620 [Lentinus tigrinus ALCF2SS1-6]